MIAEVINYTRLTISMVVITKYVYHLIQNKESSYIINMYFFIGFVFLISGIINNDTYITIRYMGKEFIPLIGILVITRYCVLQQEDCVNYIYYISSVICIFNSIMIRFFPNGFFYTFTKGIGYERVFLLGTDNNMTPYYFFSIVFLGLRLFLYNRRLHVYDAFFIISFWYAMFKVECGMGMLCSMIVTFAFVLCYSLQVKQIEINASYFRYLVYYLIIEVLVVFGVIINNIIKIAGIFFDKTESMGVRLFVWNEMLIRIIKSPLLGYGPINNTIDYNDGYLYAHNGMLDILVRGGFVCGLLFLLILFHVFRILDIYKYHRITVFVFLSVYTVLIISLLEGPFLSLKYTFVFAIVDCIGYLYKDLMFERVAEL